MPDARHLVSVWIVYVDGKRLDTDHEGALERIVIDDKLNGVGTGVLEFDSSMIKIRDSGTFSLESYVSTVNRCLPAKLQSLKGTLANTVTKG